MSQSRIANVAAVILVVLLALTLALLGLGLMLIFPGICVGDSEATSSAAKEAISKLCNSRASSTCFHRKRVSLTRRHVGTRKGSLN